MRMLPTVGGMKTKGRTGSSIPSSETAKGEDAIQGATSKEHKDPLMEAVGKRIRMVRESKGYAQEEFAYRAGIDRSYYGAVERGRYSVTAINLIRIALALEVEVGELFPARSELTALTPHIEGE